MKTHFGALILTVALFPPFAPGQQPSKDLVEPALGGRIVTLRTLAFSPDGRFLAAGSGETAAAGGKEEAGEVVIWDAKTLQVRLLHKLDHGVPSIAFSRDSKILAVGCFGEQCYLLDAETGKIEATLGGHGQAARAVAFAPDGQTLAVGSYDGTIRLWDYRAGRVLQTLKGHTDWVYCVAYSPDGSILASGSKDNSVRLWDPANGKLLRTWDDYGSILRCVVFDPTGRWLATASWDGTLKLRDHRENKLLANFSGNGVEWVAIQPSGKRMAASRNVARDVQIFPLDIREPTADEEKRIGELIARWDDDRMEVRDKASQELEKMGWIAEPLLAKAMKESQSAETRMRARLARAAIHSPKSAVELRVHQDEVLCGAFSPDDQVLATGGKDGMVVLWDAGTYRIKSKLSWPEKGP
jgi:WD40 repeat protein